MLCCVVDTSPLITGGCPEKSLPAGGICACAKWTWNMPRWITEGPSAPLAVPLHDNPREGKGRREAGWRKLGTRATTSIPTPTKFLLTYPVPSYLISSLLSFFLSLSLPLPPPTLKRAVFNWRRGKKKQTLRRKTWDHDWNSGPGRRGEYKVTPRLFVVVGVGASKDGERKLRHILDRHPYTSGPQYIF